MQESAEYRPRTDFADLAARGPFADPVAAATFPTHDTRFRHQSWAARVGLGDLGDGDWIDHFGRFQALPNGMPQPLALRYHGHQFRSYNPEIGDGRGFLFAQLQDDQGRLLDLATKGTGQTPYSRFGDGRLTLKGAVREALATEMLEALGVYTSKTFSIVETGEALERQDEPSPTRSAALVRLGHSHVRFGTFQRLAYEKNTDAIAMLVDYCVSAFDPDLAGLATDAKTARFFERVLKRSARLAAQWMAAGFVHGVLNTDNMNVTGESFDYGPWRFAPALDPQFTAAYFDQTGLYAYGRQPEAVLWNLSRLGGTLVSLSDETMLNSALARYPEAFEAAMTDAFFKRLGLTRSADAVEDRGLVMGLLQWLQQSRAPYEQVMFDWRGGAAREKARASSPLKSLYAASDFDALARGLRSYEPADGANIDHAYFAREKPRTMLIDEMEALWTPIADSEDWRPFNSAIDEIRTMSAAYDADASRYCPDPFSD